MSSFYIQDITTCLKSRQFGKATNLLKVLKIGMLFGFQFLSYTLFFFFSLGVSKRYRWQNNIQAFEILGCSIKDQFQLQRR
jgi:hypothetical protein